MKTLEELQETCRGLGIEVATSGRASKEPYIAALREYHWRKDHPDEPLPPQIQPMLLGSWEDLDEAEAGEIEADGSGWLVQQKIDGVRALLHVERDGVRVTSRTVSEVSFRLSEFQDNLTHLARGFEALVGTILDGELVSPVAVIDTGATYTENALQATMAVLATSPANAQKIQADQNARLIFHAFDILKLQDVDTAQQELPARLDLLHKAVHDAQNPYVLEMPSYVIGKARIHQSLIGEGAEGTVWKQLSGKYRPGERVRHWIKRKRGISMTAFVSNFKPGTPDRGNRDLVGAVEFSCHHADGSVSPIGWISSWSDEERRAMTARNAAGRICLNPDYLRRKAIIVGQDLSARSRRLRHARLVCWLDS